MTGRVVNLRLYKLLHTPAPWETKAHNEAVLTRLRGIASLPATAETDSDPQNPNVRWLGAIDDLEITS